MFHKKITLEEINSRFDIIEGKASEAEDRAIEDIQNKTQRREF